MRNKKNSSAAGRTDAKMIDDAVAMGGFKQGFALDYIGITRLKLSLMRKGRTALLPGQRERLRKFAGAAAILASKLVA